MSVPIRICRCLVARGRRRAARSACFSLPVSSVPSHAAPGPNAERNWSLPPIPMLTHELLAAGERDVRRPEGTGPTASESRSTADRSAPARSGPVSLMRVIAPVTCRSRTGREGDARTPTRVTGPARLCRLRRHTGRRRPRTKDAWGCPAPGDNHAGVGCAEAVDANIVSAITSADGRPSPATRLLTIPPSLVAFSRDVPHLSATTERAAASRRMAFVRVSPLRLPRAAAHFRTG